MPPNDILRHQNQQKLGHGNERVARNKAHNLIEKRHREKLNALFLQLQNTLSPIAGERDGDERAQKPNKASTLNLAREEILGLRQELRSLRQRLGTLQEAEAALSIESQ